MLRLFNSDIANDDDDDDEEEELPEDCSEGVVAERHSRRSTCSITPRAKGRLAASAFGDDDWNSQGSSIAMALLSSLNLVSYFRN